MLVMNKLSECHTTQQNNKVPLSSLLMFLYKCIRELAPLHFPLLKKSVTEKGFGVVIY